MLPANAANLTPVVRVEPIDGFDETEHGDLPRSSSVPPGRLNRLAMWAARPMWRSTRRLRIERWRVEANSKKRSRSSRSSRSAVLGSSVMDSAPNRNAASQNGPTGCGSCTLDSMPLLATLYGSRLPLQTARCGALTSVSEEWPSPRLCRSRDDRHRLFGELIDDHQPRPLGAKT